MRGPLRGGLVLGCVALAVAAAAGVIVYVLAGQSPDEQADRAQVWGTVCAAVMVVSPVVAWGWSRLKRPRPVVSTPAQVAAAADRLAVQVFDAWSRQAVRRGIQAPAPVRVRWSWAGDEVALSRQELNDSPPLSTDPPPVASLAGPLEGGQVLGSGLVTRLHEEVYARLRHGRLVLIGGPGTGKTGAMILLLLEALAHRKRVPAGDLAGVPVPVWLTLGSWDPHTQALWEWVTTTIARDHAYLRAAEFGPDTIEQLFDTGQVALFLDGLDEMPDACRGKAMERLRTEAAGRRVVLTSRPHEYRATLEAGGQLPYSAVVELGPVTPETAGTYLLEGQIGSTRAAWQRVSDHLLAHPQGVLARTLNTPLTLSLARATCTGTSPACTDPTWLLDPTLDTEQALRARLLDQVIITAYPDPGERTHATYWLGWIAHHMNTQPNGPTRDLPWWHIPNWIPRWQRKLVLGLVVGLVVGLVGGLVFGLAGGLGGTLVFGLVVGLVVGLVFGLGGGLGGGLPVPHALIIRWPSRRELRFILGFGLRFGLVVGLVVGLMIGLEVGLRFGLVVGLMVGLMIGLMIGLEVGLMDGLIDGLIDGLMDRLIDGLMDRLMDGLEVGLKVGLGYGLGFGLVFGLVFVWRNPVVNSAEASPRSTYHQDAQTQLVFGLMVGLVGGLWGELWGELWGGLVGGLMFWLASGLSFAGGAATNLFLAEVVVARGVRRVRFMRLLQTASDRQVLRQAGAVYQFRHADLQDRLAERFARDHLRTGRRGAGPDSVNPTTLTGAPSSYPSRPLDLEVGGFGCTPDPRRAIAAPARTARNRRGWCGTSSEGPQVGRIPAIVATRTTWGPVGDRSSGGR